MHVYIERMPMSTFSDLPLNTILQVALHLTSARDVGNLLKCCKHTQLLSRNEELLASWLYRHKLLVPARCSKIPQVKFQCSPTVAAKLRELMGTRVKECWSTFPGHHTAIIKWLLLWAAAAHCQSTVSLLLGLEDSTLRYKLTSTNWTFKQLASETLKVAAGCNFVWLCKRLVDTGLAEAGVSEALTAAVAGGHMDAAKVFVTSMSQSMQASHTIEQQFIQDEMDKALQTVRKSTAVHVQHGIRSRA